MAALAAGARYGAGGGGPAPRLRLRLRCCRCLAGPGPAPGPGPAAAPRSWGGLAAWRRQGLRTDLHWEGPDGEPGAPGPGRPGRGGASPPPLPPLPEGASLAALGREVLLETCVERKMELTHRAFAALHAEGPVPGSVPAGRPPLPLGRAPPVDFPGRPARPELVAPKQVPGPGAGKSGLGAAAHMLHNLAHVELNAVDLAWDTVVRFSGAGLGPALPRQFFLDFARVADDEARHLGWCLQRLGQLGHAYGDMPAHGVLWEGAQDSSGSVRARVVVIPCVQEARGLDAGPRLCQRLRDMGDRRSAAVVGQIAEEEKAHVAVGVAWLRWLCEREGQDPAAAFRAEVAENCPDGVLRGPFNVEGRAAAGLPRAWYDLERRLEDFAELEGAAAGAGGGGAPPDA